MAYTTAQLVTAYTNANLGKAPDAATTLTLDAYATQSQTGGISDATALTNTLKLVNNTTAVAVETYQFFTGAAPSAAGLAYLVNSTTNTSDLNDTYYSKFAQENRFINFSINLATGAGAGAAAFATAYGSVSYAQTVATAYDKIIGNAAAAAAGVDVSAAVAYLSRADNITYLTNFVKANTGLTAAADIDLAVKAALIGEILNAATVSGIGGYAKSTAALIADLSDGTLSTDNAAGVNIITAYPNTPVGGNTIALTTGIDAVVGTTGNDTITALQNSTTTALLTALDSIDGGAGDDTFTLVDAITGVSTAYTIPTTATIKNVETVNLTTTGNFAALNTKSWTGLTKLNLTSTGDGTGVGAVTVADTTAVNLTQAAGAVSVKGGTAVTVTNAGSGTSSVVGAALTSASVTGGGAVTVDNSSDGGVTHGDNSTLTSVTLKSVDAAATIYGKGVASVTVGGTTSADRTVTVNNGATGGHDLTVSASGTTDGTTTYTTTVVDNTANTVTVNATASAKVAVTSSTAVTVGAAGSASLSLDLANATAATAFSGGSATGNITLANIGTGVVSIATGSGNDKFTVTTTAAATVNSGAGNDTVTLAGALAAGSTINLGAGNDKLLGATVAATSTATKITVVDGGDGTDTLASALVNVGNAAQFKNFEIIGLNSAGFDLSLLTGSTITGLELFGNASGTYSNVTAAQSLTVSADSTGASNVLTFTGVSGSADAYSVTFAGAGSSTTTANTIAAGTLQVDGIEALTINSGSSSGYALNTITIGDTALRTVTITGAQDTSLALTGTVGSSASGAGVSLIDASSATGKTTINTTGAGTLNIASAGLSIKTGSGADTITIGSKAATIDAGAGNDVITTGTAGGTLTGGAGKDTFDVHLSVGASPIVTITDFTNSGDNIVFANKGNETFKAAAVDVSTATDFASALVLANSAAEAFNTGTVGTDAAVVWFQYGGNTYILEDNTSGAVGAADIVVKLTGAIDLSAGHATFVGAASTTPTLTLV